MLCVRSSTSISIRVPSLIPNLRRSEAEITIWPLLVAEDSTPIWRPVWLQHKSEPTTRAYTTRPEVVLPDYVLPRALLLSRGMILRLFHRHVHNGQQDMARLVG